jgi:hypothetical protein
MAAATDWELFLSITAATYAHAIRLWWSGCFRKSLILTKSTINLLNWLKRIVHNQNQQNQSVILWVHLLHLAGK